MSAPRGSFPTDFTVGDYIGDNFEELKRYINVLHQNGRSIYNVDQNEKQSINDTWKRRIMQNLLGDASVEDAFQVVGTGADNDFQLVGGDNAPATPKNAFVGGFMPIADANTTYLLHNTQYNEDFGAIPVPLTTPSGSNRTDVVYLDVFLKEISGLDDDFLIPDNLKVALTTRLRLIQEVKVVEGGSIPASPFTTAGGTTHFLFPLATIERFDGQAAITEFDVTDDRRTITFGTLANGGLALTDPGGMQAANDNTSGGIPSATRHLILGTDDTQGGLDAANSPSAVNPIITQNDLPATILAGTSNTQDGITAMEGGANPATTLNPIATSDDIGDLQTDLADASLGTDGSLDIGYDDTVSGIGTNNVHASIDALKVLIDNIALTLQTGNFTGSGNNTPFSVFVGFQPRFLYVAITTGFVGSPSHSWMRIETMATGTAKTVVGAPEVGDSTTGVAGDRVDFTSTGFDVETNRTFCNQIGVSYAWIALG